FFEVYFQVEKKFRDVNKVRLLKISLLFITFFSLQLFKFISLTNIYLIFTLSTLLTLIYSVWRSKVISLHVNISGINLSVLKEKIKIGMPYLMGNFIILLTVNVDKNFISVFSTKESFAIYGFASIFLIILKELINSLKSFIFPYLNSTYKDKREKIYNILSLYIIFGFSLTIVILPIIKYVILKYYPIYNLSIKLVPILFVATTFESLTIILHSNYYQTYNYYKNYLINSAFIGVIIYGIFFTCYALNPNLSLLNYAYMALFCGIMRVLFNDIYLRKKMNIRLINSLYMFIPFSALLINFLI
ncbi:hypothetical protein, partial [Clostridium sp.]|uniref:hypothetical protein n=1 Tax=Clostridium sp. TaxID=1506 RepID=UPI002852346A